MKAVAQHSILTMKTGKLARENLTRRSKRAIYCNRLEILQKICQLKKLITKSTFDGPMMSCFMFLEATTIIPLFQIVTFDCFCDKTMKQSLVKPDPFKWCFTLIRTWSLVILNTTIPKRWYIKWKCKLRKMAASDPNGQKGPKWPKEAQRVQIDPKWPKCQSGQVQHS